MPVGQGGQVSFIQKGRSKETMVYTPNNEKFVSSQACFQKLLFIYILVGGKQDA